MKEGWEYNKIGKLCKTYSGGTPLKNVKEYYQNGNIPWLRSGEVCKKYISETEMFITQKGLENSSAKYYPIDTVVVAMYGATAAQVGILKIEATSNQAVCGILPNRKFLPEFLYYFFCYRKEFLASQAQGGAQPNISQVKIKNLEVPVPPLSEQQSIVDYLDSAFAKIDAMKANAEKSLNEAKALFQASLKEMLEPKEGWEEKKFGDVCWYNKNNGIHKGTRYVGMEHIEQGTGKLLDTISSDEVLSNTFAFNKGDVLYGRLRPYLKKVIVADFDGCCSTEIFPIQSKSIIASFLKYWFLTDKITNKVNATCAGCRMPRGNMNDVLKFDISYPGLSEQQSIVETLDSLKSKVDRLQANYDKISQECDALKQAILRQVFE